MNIKEVNEIFKTKYANGKIYQKGSFGSQSSCKVSVIFDETKENAKVYDYVCDTNYANLLKRFGFQVEYNKTKTELLNKICRLQDEIKELKMKLQSGETKVCDIFFPSITYDILKETEKRQNELNTIKNIIENTEIIWVD